MRGGKMDEKFITFEKGMWIRIVLFIVAAAFIVYGISRGEAAVTFTKAVNICLECIGIG